MMQEAFLLDKFISIHAPREEGDIVRFVGRDLPYLISIHAPREEGDPEKQ